MDKQQLEELVDLPDYFIFKIIVDRSDLDLDHFINLAAKALGRAPDVTKKHTRASRGGKYQAHTLHIYVNNMDEIEAVYSAYRGERGVTMVL